MSHRILQKFVISSSRGSKLRCDICDVKFQFLVKQEHQCKRCYRSVCEECGPDRRNVYDFDGSWGMHRCCLFCIKEIEKIHEYQNSYKLCLGQDSQFVQDWINKLNKEHKQYDEILNEYTDNVTMITNENTIRFKRDSEVLFRDLMDSCNYSLRDFLHKMTEEVKGEILEKKVSGVMVGVYARVKSLPYIPELIYVAAFFLCFASEAHSYFIVSRLIEKVYPQYVRVKKLKKDNLLSSSLKTILEMYRICVDRLENKELEAIAQYIENRFQHFIVSFTLNVCSMPNSFFIIEEMLKSGNYLALYKGIAGLLSNCRLELASYQSFAEVEIPILREVSLEKLKNNFIKFQKNDTKFQVNNGVFDSAEHRKLHEKYKQMEILYSKLEASLNEKELKMKEMGERMARKAAELDMQTNKVTSLQDQLLSLSHHLPQLANYATMQSQNQYALARNAQLEKKCQILQFHIENFEKEKAQYEKMNRMWSSLEKDYIEETQQLKTRNEILEIKVAAKQIDFDTSSIERSLSAKNNENKLLKAEITHLKSDLQYYKLKVLQNRFNLNHSRKAIKPPESIDKDAEFKKHMEHSNEIVKKKTKQLQEKIKEYMEKEQRVAVLESQLEAVRSELKEVQEVSTIIKSIPQEFMYEESIGQLERMAENEQNFIRKKTIESGIDGFKNCHKELKFRIIDARVKEEKIRNSVLVKLLNPSTFSSLKREEEQKRDGLADLFSMVQTAEPHKNKDGECLLM